MDIQEHRAWLLSLVPLPTGADVLDLGCGAGDDLRGLAERIDGADARFVGIDAQEKKIAEARERTSDPRCDFRVVRIEASLPFDDASFDLVLTQEFLECVVDPAAIVAEIARVLKPGGLVVASHYDWDTQTFNASDRERTRRVLQAWADCELATMDSADPWMGRRLWGLFSTAGHFEGELHTRVMSNTVFAEPYHGYRMVHWMKGLPKRGLVSETDYREFCADVEETAAAGHYFWGVNRYVYVGTRREAG